MSIITQLKIRKWKLVRIVLFLHFIDLMYCQKYYYIVFFGFIWIIMPLVKIIFQSRKQKSSFGVCLARKYVTWCSRALNVTQLSRVIEYRSVSSNFRFCISTFSWPYFSRTWWKTLAHQILHESVRGGGEIWPHEYLIRLIQCKLAWFITVRKQANLHSFQWG